MTELKSSDFSIEQMDKFMEEGKLMRSEDAIIDTDPDSTFGGRLVRGINVLGGREGRGKSTLSLWLAAHISSGSKLPGTFDDEEVPYGDVLILSTEDSYSRRQKPKLTVAGADHSRILYYDKMLSGPTELGNLIVEWKQKAVRPTMIIIDPVRDVPTGNIIVSGVSITGAGILTGAIGKVIDIESIYLVVVQHTNKGQGQSLLDGFQEGGWTKKARNVLRLEEAELSDGEDALGLWHAKTNIVEQLSDPLPLTIDNCEFYDNKGRPVKTSQIKLLPYDPGLTVKPYESFQGYRTVEDGVKRQKRVLERRDKIMSLLVDEINKQTEKELNKKKAENIVSEKFKISVKSARTDIGSLISCGRLVKNKDGVIAFLRLPAGDTNADDEHLKH